jgi:hypothetical protein
VVIVQKCDMKSLFLMLLKSYHLHAISKVESLFSYKIDEDRSLAIFEMVNGISKPTNWL